MAKKLEDELEKQAELPIEAKLLYEQNLRKFNAKLGLRGKDRIGDMIVKDTSTKDIVRLIENHHRARRQPKKGAK